MVMMGRPLFAMLAAAVVASLASGVDAYVSSPTLRRQSSIRSSRSTKVKGEESSALYLFTPPSTATATSHKERRRSSMHHPSSNSRLHPRRSTGRAGAIALPAMSASVLAESDTLPSFRSAHGLLSPEVVARIADTVDFTVGSPVHTFLKTYRSRGPIACLGMLSDPAVLPELTRAMRDIA